MCENQHVSAAMRNYQKTNDQFINFAEWLISLSERT